jgi:hypothetical protein
MANECIKTLVSSHNLMGFVNVYLWLAIPFQMCFLIFFDYSVCIKENSLAYSWEDFIYFSKKAALHLDLVM